MKSLQEMNTLFKDTGKILQMTKTTGEQFKTTKRVVFLMTKNIVCPNFIAVTFSNQERQTFYK